MRSAMSTREARSRCPHAAFLSGRFHAYRAASEQVMAVLRATSPLVEPLSLDEAFVDLAAAGLDDLEIPTVTALAERLREQVAEVTGGLTASVGVGSSKFIAKVASDLDKPDGLVVVPPGTEVDLLRPMHVSVIPGVGPATTERLRRAGLHTVADLESVGEDELVRLLGSAHGHGLHELAHARDGRPVVSERETKSVSVEGTYDTDLTDRKLMAALLTRQSRHVAERLRASGLAGRTVTIKVRLHDFTTLNRSSTLGSPTDTASTISPAGRRAAPGPRHDRRRTAPRRRRLRAGRLDPGGPLRDDRGRRAARGRPRRGGAVDRGRQADDPHLGTRHGRRARGPGPRLGLGLGPRRGDGAVRDGRDRTGSRAELQDRRPRPRTLETWPPTVDFWGYSRRHARTTSLTSLRTGPRSRHVSWRTPRCASSSRSSRSTPCSSPTPGCPPARCRRCWSSGRRPTCCSRCRPAPGPTPCHDAGCSCLAAALYACCFALWSAVPTYAAFAGGFVLWGLSGSLVSGTYEAYVYDHLYARQRQDSYRKVIAAGETSALVLNLVATAAATPIVALWGLTGAGWASVAVCVAATGLALWLPDDAPRSHVDPEPRHVTRPTSPTSPTSACCGPAWPSRCIPASPARCCWPPACRRSWRSTSTSACSPTTSASR